MKKTASLGALLLALALPLAAQAETVFAGEVTAETAQVIAAPYGGLVEDVRVRVGDSVKIGDPIATVETAKTYASTDGTVSGVFAHEGDSADGVKTQYGALVYIEPINRFTLACSTEKGYNSSENRYIHIGETVFLKCTKDGSHQGRGVVTGLDEKDDSISPWRSRAANSTWAKPLISTAAATTRTPAALAAARSAERRPSPSTRRAACSRCT